MKFTEAQLESAIIELLEAEGYPHVLGEAIERQPQKILIKADLRTFLAKQYADDGITPQEIEAVINQLEAYSAADLYESNKAIMKLVRRRLPPEARRPHPEGSGESGQRWDQGVRGNDPEIPDGSQRGLKSRSSCPGIPDDCQR